MTPISVVGIGLAGAADLSAEARAVVDQASLLIGGQRHLSYFPDHPAPKRSLGNLKTALDQIQQDLIDHPQHHIVILASGDPLFFGIGRLLLTVFPEEQLTFYPHLSSVQIAFNRLKIPWQDTTIISLHGRPPERLIQALQRGDRTLAIFTDATHTPAAIARLFLSLDLAVTYQFWVCEELGSSTEQIQSVDPVQLQNQSFAALNLVILVRRDQAVPNITWPYLGIPDQAFLGFPDRPGLMTKREVRVLAISELELQPNQIIWDIGAGTGSVAIEMARLSPGSTIYAVEKTAIGHQLIQQNCQRFQVENVNVIHGEALHVCPELPPPNRIFIGGSGGNLTAILDRCQSYRYSPIVAVLAIATLETLETALHWFRKHQWSTQLLQVQLSRSVPIGTRTRWHPLNPVTLIKARPQPPE